MGKFNYRLISSLLVITVFLSVGFAPHGGGTPEVEVSISPNSRSGWPGENVTFIITVNNASLVTDTYALHATNTGSLITQIMPASLTLAAGAVGEAILRVTIPTDAPGNTLVQIDVDVRSTGNPGDYAIGQCTVFVMGAGEVEIPYLVILLTILVIVGIVLVAGWLLHRVKRGGPRRILLEWGKILS